LLLDNRLTALLKEDCRYAERLTHKMSLFEKLDWSIKATIDNALDQWLTRQGKENAFEILKDRNGQFKLQNSAYQWHQLTQKSRKGKKSGFSSVDFTGDLEITDAGIFKDKICEGIGRSKAFGCGLMLVKRI
jgi:CRISPR system Cascade subunit CasE